MTDRPTDHDDVTLRPITGPDELDLFCQLPYNFNDELADDLDGQRRRPDWMWVAVRGDHLLARVAWWTRSGHDTPYSLDIFDLDDRLPAAQRLQVGEALLRTAMAAVVADGADRPEYDRCVPANWRDTAATRQVVEDRMTLLERTGARLFVERLRLEWRPGTAVPRHPHRLEFRPAQDTEELITLMTAVLDGTLDAHGQADLTRMSAREAAMHQYEDELAGYRSPRDWWQIATLPSGEAVGFVIPARNDYNHIVAYIGVVPAHRGHGYIDDILAEGTRILADQKPPRIRAATDLGNVPMARAFERAGYVNFERTINMTWN